MGRTGLLVPPVRRQEVASAVARLEVERLRRLLLQHRHLHHRHQHPLRHQHRLHRTSDATKERPRQQPLEERPAALPEACPQEGWEVRPLRRRRLPRPLRLLHQPR